jgi:hypothetical protein
MDCFGTHELYFHPAVRKIAILLAAIELKESVYTNQGFLCGVDVAACALLPVVTEVLWVFLFVSCSKGTIRIIQQHR